MPHPSRSRLLGLACTLGAVALLAGVFHPPTLPWADQFRFSLAAGTSFGQLDQNAAVDIGGLKAGKVEGVIMRGGRAVVQVEVDGRYAHLLHADTTAVIRPHGLLGPKYVDLSGGSRGRLAAGTLLPADQVHVTTDVDQVLNALQPDVRQSLKTLLVELSKGSDGQGQNVNAALAALGGSARDLETVTGTLHRRDQDLAQFFADAQVFNSDLQYAPVDAQLRDTDSVLAGLAQVEGAMGSGIDHTARVLSDLDVVMNGNTQNLAYVLSRSPATVTRLETVVALADQLVVGVNPSLPYLMTAVTETESAFSGADANGHYVRVMSAAGACTLGVSLNCAGTPSSAGRGSAAGVPGSAPAAPPGAAASPPAASRATDQDLMRMLLGN